jgi:Protein of unknown function (DUF3224)
MTTHAEATFMVSDWQEDTRVELDGDTKITRASWVQSYEGDIEGAETVQCLMYYRADGTVLTVSLSSFAGSVGGRSGSFVMQRDGQYADGQATSGGSVVVGSGTGELEGLQGTGHTGVGHDMKGTFTFDYDLG